MKLTKLSLDKFLKIWRQCYKDNPSQRVKLNQLDDRVTKRGALNENGYVMVQLNPYEITFIKNLYEAVI